MIITRRDLETLVPSCFYFLNLSIDKKRSKLYNHLQDKAMNGKSMFTQLSEREIHWLEDFFNMED
jgi:hypothetical protein